MDNNMNILGLEETGNKVACRACVNRSVQLPSWHSGEATYAGSLPYASATLRCMRQKGPGKQSKNATVTTSTPGDHSQAESRHMLCDVMPYVYRAKNSADINEAGYPNVGNRTR